MVISEIFYSLQGEGLLAGVPSVFIRIAGCPLRCRWCDTRYAWDSAAGTDYTAEQVKSLINKYPTRYAVITGGEPMTQPGLKNFIAGLTHDLMHVTIETAGIEYQAGLRCDLMSISPKLSNSRPSDRNLSAAHEKQRYNIIAMKKLMADYDYQLKFVIDEPDDLDEVAASLDGLGAVNPEKIFLMPQAATAAELLEKSKWLADYCKQTGFRLSQRLQILFWPGQRGK